MSAISKKRVSFILCIFGLVLLYLISRIVYLQVFNHKYYDDLAIKNQLNTLHTDSDRGLIFDSNNQVIADNFPKYALAINISDPNFNDTVNALKDLIHLDQEEINSLYKKIKSKKKNNQVILKNELTENEINLIAANRYRLSAIELKVKRKRIYPMHNLYSHILGYVGLINSSEFADVSKHNYTNTTLIGKTGIEKAYEEVLHGNIGYKKLTMNSLGKNLYATNATDPIPGANLYLTVNTKLQQKAYDLFQKMHLTGALIAVNPSNGNILTYVNFPNYDPNVLVDCAINHVACKALLQNKNNLLFDKIILGQFSPGSTIKPIMALSALMNNSINPNKKIKDNGYYIMENTTHIYKDWKKNGHGDDINMEKAIAVSCDVYFYKLAEIMGIKQIYNTLNLFGFGKSLNLDFGNTASGLIPDKNWKMRKYHTQWYKGDTIVSGIGQGYLLVTPIQLVIMLSAIAENGIAYIPHVVEYIKYPNKNIEYIAPKVLFKLMVNNSYWQIIKNGMAKVVTEKYGTAHDYFNNAAYTIAAKTGTVQLVKKENLSNLNHSKQNLIDNSMFIAFTPMINPKLAVVILIQNSPIHASMLARQFIDYYYQIQNEIKQ